MYFLHFSWLLLVVLLPLPYIALRAKGYLGFSHMSLMHPQLSSRYLHRLPIVAFSLAFVCLLLALARPQRNRPEGHELIQSRDIVIAIDKSGSMGQPFAGEIPKPEETDAELDKELPPRPPKDATGKKQERGKYGPIYDPNSLDPEVRKGHVRINAAQAVLSVFVRNRYKLKAGDRVGILLFDDVPHWSWPLTDDLKQIYRKGIFADEGVGGGTNFGNSGNGPIDVAIAHFDERGQASAKVVIMITDGEAPLTSSSMERLKGELTSHMAHLYVIGIGPTLANSGTPISTLAADTNGKVYRVENAKELLECFSDIDQLERSPVLVATQMGHDELFFYFAYACIGFVFLGAVAEAFVHTQ